MRNRSLRYPVPEDLHRLLQGRTLVALTRRAKYLLFETDGGILLIHLGMSGSLRIVTPESPPNTHDHVDLMLEEVAIRYRDPRRFGLMLWLPPGAPPPPMLTRLGREPLEDGFDGAYLAAAARNRKTSIKSLIMDGTVVVGVGNIYAAESLFRAGIRPTRNANRISAQRLNVLADAIKATLLAAIAAGGSTLRDFVGSDGSPGYFQQHYSVYGREGLPCPVCGTPVKRVTIGQRSTCFCPSCQR